MEKQAPSYVAVIKQLLILCYNMNHAPHSTQLFSSVKDSKQSSSRQKSKLLEVLSKPLYKSS